MAAPPTVTIGARPLTLSPTISPPPRIRSNSVGIGTGMTLVPAWPTTFGWIKPKNAAWQQSTTSISTRNDVALQVASAFLSLMFAEDALEIADLNVQTTRRPSGPNPCLCRSRCRTRIRPVGSCKLNLHPTNLPDLFRGRGRLGQAATGAIHAAQPEPMQRTSRIERPNISSDRSNMPALPAIDKVLNTALTYFSRSQSGRVARAPAKHQRGPGQNRRACLG